MLTIPKHFYGKVAAGLLLSAYLTSLCLPALYDSRMFWGIECLGALPIVMIAPPWWANPLFFAGIVHLANGKYRNAFWFGIGASALVMAMPVMQFGDLWRHCPYGPGWFLWLSCMFGLVAFSIFGLKRT